MSKEPFDLHRVYARYEPTTDPIAIKYLPPAVLARARDVAIYQDEEATRPLARYGCDRKRPSRRTRVITLNCWTRSIHWMPSLTRKSQLASRSPTAGRRSAQP